ncbi:MAG: tripartite tricarboxylate transporter substrate binding protein BugD [Rhodoferax sp.]|nr:tripartite tricarboxylate transporter substrate binding protein BugD [Rhodoferax sp.]
MTNTFSSLRAAACLCLALCGLAHTQAQAQKSFPTRPINVISGFATGGSVDVLTRVVVEQMARDLGEPLVVQTIAGAGGTIGSARAAHSPPDGYTLVAGSSGSNAAAYATYEKPPYSPDDFHAVGLLAIIPSVVIVKKDLPVTTLAELVAYARAHPNKLSFGHPGVGSSVHLQCELFKQVAGIDIQMVPYRGAGPLMGDVIGGQIDGACDAAPSSTGPSQAGQIRAIAVMGDRRASSMPEIPTTVESGMPKLQGAAWVALFAPKGTPDAVLDRLSRALDSALDSAEVQQRLAKLGTSTPTSAQRGRVYSEQFVRDEIAKWDQVARAAQVPKQ